MYTKYVCQFCSCKNETCNYKIINIASLSRSLHGHVYSALQYCYKIGISKVLNTFYFYITFFFKYCSLFLGFHNTVRDSGAIRATERQRRKPQPNRQRWTRRTMILNVSVLSIPKQTMNKNLCQHCPNIMPTIIVSVGQRWANVILTIFRRWANIAPTCWANVGTLCTYNVGPTLKANVGPTKWTMLAQRWANVCVLSGIRYTWY